MPFLKYKNLKLKLRVFLAGHSVAMVTYCVTKIIPTCSSVIGQFFDTMVVADQVIKGSYNDTSKSKSLNVLETVLSHLKSILMNKWHLNKKEISIKTPPPCFHTEKVDLWKTYTLEQSFEGQIYHFLTNRSRVWPVNHFYHHHNKFVQGRRISYIAHVRVAPAAADLQSVF